MKNTFMFQMEWVYILCGMLLLMVALASWARRNNPKRFGNASFFAIAGLAISFASVLPNVLLGAMVLALVVLASFNLIGASPDGPSAALRIERANKIADQIFIPALAIPLLTVIFLFTLSALLPKDQAALICLALACSFAWLLALKILRARAYESLQSTRHLLETIGWPVLLPLLLAILGGVFAQTGVGEVISALAQKIIPAQSRFACVLAYVIGMAGFTMVMGNAFAAFPVMTAGIGIPLIVRLHGGDPAVMAAIGMLSGYCGTLMTPMAANFNLVPVALLELNDRSAVIKAQIGTAIPLLLVNVFLMYGLVFR